ncbi:hypothetical protein PybrP1_002426 [[Pythium] brassicae (nom. inval.)]|nr:hypothetical protein PybrP1_002426 [[Pythium] brassicae (nom. inval.)]
MSTYSSSLPQQQRKRKPEPIDDAKNRSGSERSTTSSTSSSSSSSQKSASRKATSASKSSSSSSSSKRARARFSVPEDAQGLSRFASHTGFLRKQADNEQGAWNRYYFALRPATLLYYYNTPTDESPRGIIDLEFLKDIRLNVDCLQRAIGGSEHCFRVTGQMPRREDHGAGSSAESGGSSAAKLRPVYLDPESADEAHAWMLALQHHRFNAEHANGFYTLSARVQATEQTLQRLENEAARIAVAADSIRRSGRVLLNQLRGLEVAGDDTTASTSGADVLATLQEIESLVEDFNAEAAQQAKVIATLRERDAQQEKKLRELAKLAAAAPPPPPPQRPGASGPGAADDSSILSAEELGRMERAGAAKARSTSDVRGLFKVRANFLGKKPADAEAAAAAAPTSSPKAPQLEPCAEGAEPEEEESEEAPVKKMGFAGVFMKRVAKSAAPAAPAGAATATAGAASGTPTSRESDDTVSVSTDDRESVEAPGADDKLPRGWVKRASRTSPNEHYFVHTASGFTCWEIPSDFAADDEPDEPPAGDEKKDKDKGGGGGESAQPPPAVVAKPLESFAAVAVAAMEDTALDESSAGDDASKPPAKKASKGWAIFKKLSKPAKAAAPASPQSPVAVEHDDGRHEF